MGGFLYKLAVQNQSISTFFKWEFIKQPLYGGGEKISSLFKEGKVGEGYIYLAR
jgi:hypothetical protein